MGTITPATTDLKFVGTRCGQLCFEELSEEHDMSRNGDIQCHQFEMSCSILIVNCGIVSPTLNVNPRLFVVPCNFLGGRF